MKRLKMICYIATHNDSGKHYLRNTGILWLSHRSRCLSGTSLSGLYPLHSIKMTERLSLTERIREQKERELYREVDGISPLGLSSKLNTQVIKPPMSAPL